MVSSDAGRDESATKPLRGRVPLSRPLSGAPAALLAAALFAIVPGTAAAGNTDPVLLAMLAQTGGGGFCSMPFLGDLATWATPKFTGLLIAAGAGVVGWGILGAPAEGRGRLSLRAALALGLLMFYLGLQWAPFWEYIGGIFGGSGAPAAVTCGL